MERFTIFKNNENIYRIQINEGIGSPRWMTDTDLMLAVLGSHISKIIDCGSKEQAQYYIKKLLEKEEMVRKTFAPKEPEVIPVVSDTFKPV